MLVIGEIVKKRMELLGMDIDSLSDASLIEKNRLEDLLNNKVALEDFEENEQQWLADALLCKYEYFCDENARKCDVLFSSQNRGVGNTESNKAKARLQKFMRDLTFVREAK